MIPVQKARSENPVLEDRLLAEARALGDGVSSVFLSLLWQEPSLPSSSTMLIESRVTAGETRGFGVIVSLHTLWETLPCSSCLFCQGELSLCSLVPWGGLPLPPGNMALFSGSHVLIVIFALPSVQIC